MVMQATKQATPTQRAIAEMLVENTGSHFLDSGGVYGRAWQHTRAAFGLDSGLPNSTFSGGPKPGTKDPQDDEIERVALAMAESPAGGIDTFGSVSVDTFHWLTDRVEYDETLDRKFQRWIALRKSDNHWIAEVEEFIEQLGRKVELGDGMGGKLDSNRNGWINTYNHDNSLDRTLQFLLFEVEDDSFLPEGSYVILQIHGGADVRGGYTAPRLFTLPGYEGVTDMLDFDRVEVWCDGADVVPDNQVTGQVSMEGEVLKPEHVSHYWDTSYGDGLLSNDDSDEALGFAYDEDESVETIEPDSYQSRYGAIKAIRLARKDDEGVWRCPYDNSPLHVQGAIVG